MIEKQSFRERLAAGTVLFDGAFGTLLNQKGVPMDVCLDATNISDPELVVSIHRDYLEAGAEVIETNTFGANRFKLEEHGLADSVARINWTGVNLARRAVEEAGRGDVYIAGAVGPLGVRLAPIGRVTTESAYDAFHEQITALNEAGVDLLILETFSNTVELAEAIRAARDVNPDLFVVAQMTFTRDDRTLMGETPSQVVNRLDGADAIGVNCSNGPAQVRRIIARMRQVNPGIPLTAVPNAGFPENVGGRALYIASPGYFASFTQSMREIGVAAVGGCCGTTPEHIAAMRSVLNEPAPPIREPVSVTLQSDDEETSGDELFAPSRLAGKLAAGELVVAVEMSPPKGVATEKELQAVALLAEVGADVIDVLDSPMARMRMSPWALCSLLQNQLSIETVLHFPTRGRNLLRVQGALLAAHALGVRNLFVVMGDPTRIGDYPDAHDNYDIVPSSLIKLVKENLNAGIDQAGNSIGQPTNFLVSGALSPNAPDPDREVRVLRKKVVNGADYFLTQPIYDVNAYKRFMERYAEQHGPLDRPVLVGLLPLYSLRNALFLHNEVPGILIPESILDRMKHADDPRREGVRIAQELAVQFAEVAAGLYLSPQFGRFDLAADVIEAVKHPAQ
ncbi:MAG: bifunctional homocysteine S-methyltransferase/methylenetetrahydrofolate reductase [Anaerolineae bacterium]